MRSGLSPPRVQRAVRASPLRSGVFGLARGLAGRFAGVLHLAALAVFALVQGLVARLAGMLHLVALAAGRSSGVLRLAALLELAGGFALSAMIDSLACSLGSSCPGEWLSSSAGLA